MSRTPRTRAPSINQAGAADVLQRLSAIRDDLAEVDQRGGILTVLNQAGLPESGWDKLVSDFQSIATKVRGFVVTIGDHRRETGKSLPLCWTPESESPAEHPHDTAGESFVSKMKES
jgi:hypothetical protein